MNRFLYLIEAQMGVLKIGCAFNPLQRLATIRTHSPVLVRLIAMWPGTTADEYELHRRFDAQRLHCEWFQIDGALRSFVAERHGLGLEQVDAWDGLKFHSRDARVSRSKAARSRNMKAVWSDPEWKLRQLGQLLAGRLEAQALGHIPHIARTKEDREQERAIRERAHEQVRTSAQGRRLLAEIATRRKAV